MENIQFCITYLFFGIRKVEYFFRDRIFGIQKNFPLKLSYYIFSKKFWRFMGNMQVCITFLIFGTRKVEYSFHSNHKGNAVLKIPKFRDCICGIPGPRRILFEIFYAKTFPILFEKLATSLYLSFSHIKSWIWKRRLSSSCSVSSFMLFKMT